MVKCPYCAREYEKPGFWLDYHLLIKHQRAPQTSLSRIMLGLTILGILLAFIQIYQSVKTASDTQKMAKIVEEIVQLRSPEEAKRLLAVKYNMAYEQFETLLESFAKEATSAYDRGLSQLAAGSYTLAIQSFAKAIQANPRNVDAYVYRGIAYSDNGELQKALDDLSQAIRLDRTNGRIYYNLGIVHLRNTTYDQAITNFTKAASLAPPHFQGLIYLNRGHAYRYTMDYANTIKDYSSAITLRPDMLGIYYMRGIVYFLVGEYDKALVDLDKAMGDSAIAQDPAAKSIRSLVFLFALTAGIKDYDYQVELGDLQRQIEEFPDAEFLWAVKGLMSEKAKKTDEALSYYRKALDLNKRTELAQVGYQRLSRVLSEKTPAALAKTVLKVAETRQITRDLGNCTSPRWNPDGSTIVFVSDKFGNRDIWRMDVDGSRQVRLTTDNSDDTSPSWTPDGRMIVFQSGQSGNSDIWVMSKDGRDKKRLTSSTAFDGQPVWSVDGKIAYVSDLRGAGYYDIWVMDSEGRNKRQLTNSRYTGHFYPSWSPDGKRLVFVDKKLVMIPPTVESNIWVTDSEGSNMAQLTKGIASENPVWSPDGKRIAFVAGDPGKKDIWIMDANGSNQARLTTDSADYSSLSWSLDGKYIVVDSFRLGTRNLWILTLTHGEQP